MAPRSLTQFRDQAGRIVYRPGYTDIVGKVVKVGDNGRVYVYWFDKKEVLPEHAWSLQDLETLVVDTEGMARKYRSALEKAYKEGP